MKKVLKTIAVLLLPLFLFLNVWQVFSYRMVESDIAELEKQQKKLLEENKRLIIGIEFLRNPARLEKAAEEQLGMKRAQSDKIIRIAVPPAGAQDG